MTMDIELLDRAPDRQRLPVADRDGAGSAPGNLPAGFQRTEPPVLFGAFEGSDPAAGLKTEAELIGVCRALVPLSVELSVAEQALVGARIDAVPARLEEQVRQAIQAGHDPLGVAFCRIRSAAHRRVLGAVYTPPDIVAAMVRWLASHDEPSRIVDPGAGSGRFILAAARSCRNARLVAVEMDPLAALTLRANLQVCGYADRTTLHVMDYRDLVLDSDDGVTAFIGNPPYVRHHDIAPAWKRWYVSQFAALGFKVSALAGLHLHFFLKTRLLARAGDIGTFITSAEWLDVNYGSALRRLLIGEFGGVALHVLEPAVDAFPGTATTAAITCFRVGETRAPMQVLSVAELDGLGGLAGGEPVERERFENEPRWSSIVRPRAPRSGGEIELGSLFRVHRGQVTGANAVWIAGEHAASLPPQLSLPCVTRAMDLIRAGESLLSPQSLRRVIDLPRDLDGFSDDERRRIEAFLSWARSRGADQGYIARHRKAWWSVGLRAAAPILCTYMARRAPQFTLNPCGARHINIAHGLYPLVPISDAVLAKLVSWLNRNVDMASGRTYAGGLTKFEPKEIERLLIPRLETLAS